MGREIKRVPLDFDWPVGKIWALYFISTCIDKLTCEDCRQASKLKGLKFQNHNCPDFNLGPPLGDGYQLWETTSEGSPMSPVFETPEELAEWLEATEASSFGPMTCSYDQWLEFIKGPGWAPSAILDEKGFRSGVCAINDI